MPWSTARARLTRQILLKLLIEAGTNVCFQCSREITSVDELSIEHKIPWLRKDVELFWDLDNIAFSHPICNAQAYGQGVTPANFKPVEEGYAWCSGCQDQKPSDQFHFQKTGNRRTTQAYCRDCHNDRERLRKRRVRAQQRQQEGKPATKNDLLIASL